MNATSIKITRLSLDMFAVSTLDGRLIGCVRARETGDGRWVYHAVYGLRELGVRHLTPEEAGEMVHSAHLWASND